MPVSPGSVGQVAVPVGNVERATAFYREVLGLEFLFAAPPELAFFRCGEIRLMLSAGDGEGDASAVPLLYYRVEDIESAHVALDGHAVEVVREPEITHRDDVTELWIGFYRDSERNLFALMEERAAGEGEGG